jgi:hypothetical protein
MRNIARQGTCATPLMHHASKVSKALFALEVDEYLKNLSIGSVEKFHMPQENSLGSRGRYDACFGRVG